MEKKFHLVFVVLLALLSTNLSAQKIDTTTSVIDKLTGTKKEVHTVKTGTTATLFGTAPNITERTITIYDSNGKIIYLSHYKEEQNGCEVSILLRDAIAYYADGSSKTLKMKRKGKPKVESHYKKGSLPSRASLHHNNQKIYDWLEKEDRQYL
jgi:hypothetical protein